MSNFTWGGNVTGGSFFTYHGIRYGKGTQIRFNQQFYDARNKPYSWSKRKEEFDSIVVEGEKSIWCCGIFGIGERYADVVPDRDIYAIIKPYYYFEPKELARTRLQNGTWINYVWKQTLFYVICLLISPIFKEWYLIWTIGLYAYLRLCYIALSKP